MGLLEKCLAGYIHIPTMPSPVPSPSFRLYSPFFDPFFCLPSFIPTHNPSPPSTNRRGVVLASLSYYFRFMSIFENFTFFFFFRLLYFFFMAS